MAVRTVLPPFNGGEEKIYVFTFLESAGVNSPDIPTDLTDHVITAEIWWDDCRKILLRVDDGIEILNLAPPAPLPGQDPEPQFQIRLTEQQTSLIPRGKGGSFIKIIDVPPGGKTEITGPFFLERAL